VVNRKDNRIYLVWSHWCDGFQSSDVWKCSDGWGSSVWPYHPI